MDLKKIFQSKKYKKILCGIGAAVIILLVFQAGMFVGYKKAAFSYRWGDNYYRAFGRHHGKFMPGIFGEWGLSNSHGSIGKIIKVELPTLALEDKDGTEKIILVTSNTIIKRFRETIKPADLKAGDFIVVVGSSDDTPQIEAKIIRVMPYPQNFMGTSTPKN